MWKLIRYVVALGACCSLLALLTALRMWHCEHHCTYRPIRASHSHTHTHSKVTFSEFHTFHTYAVVNVTWTTILTILSSQMYYIPAYNHCEPSIMKHKNCSSVYSLCIHYNSFILRNIILPKFLIHHNIMKMSFLCHFINGWDATRTIFVEKLRFALCYFVGYIFVYLFTCAQYSRHIPWDRYVTDITKTEIFTGNRTHLKSHTLHNCIVEEDLNTFLKLHSTSFEIGQYILYPVQTFFFSQVCCLMTLSCLCFMALLIAEW